MHLQQLQQTESSMLLCVHVLVTNLANCISVNCRLPRIWYYYSSL